MFIRKITHTLLLVGSGFLFVGCSGLAPQKQLDSLNKKPDQFKSEQLPAKWSAMPESLLTAGEVVNGNWWETFKDAHLNRMVTHAVGNNYQVWQSRARLAQARAQVIIADAQRWPHVGTGLQANKAPKGQLPTGLHESYGLGFNISWEIDLWQRLGAQTAAANEGYLASYEALRAVRQAIAAQTAKAYLGVVAYKQQVGVARQTLNITTEAARQVGNRADVGIASPGDKYLALSNRESVRAKLAGQQEALDRISRQLQLLLGDYPDAKVVTANALPPLPALPRTGIPAGVLARRPDVLASEKQLRAAGFSVVSARRSLLPTINLSSQYGTASTDLKNLLKGDFLSWTLGGKLLQPLFQGGALRANVKLQEAKQQEAANAYIQTALTALSEVETALAARATIKQRQTALCSAAKSAKTAERVAFNRYRQGLEPYIMVLESQRRTLDATSACISAQQAGLNNYIDLQLALGGGFEEAGDLLADTKKPPKTTLLSGTDKNNRTDKSKTKD